MGFISVSVFHFELSGGSTLNVSTLTQHESEQMTPNLATKHKDTMYSEHLIHSDDCLCL